MALKKKRFVHFNWSKVKVSANTHFSIYQYKAAAAAACSEWWESECHDWIAIFTALAFDQWCDGDTVVGGWVGEAVKLS